LNIPEEWKPQDLRDGSRVKPDGETIKWQVAFPQASARGKAPFWCFDVTPREKRVTSDPKLVTHPSGALGVRQIATFFGGSLVKDVQKMMSSILQKRSDDLYSLATVKTGENFGGSEIGIRNSPEQYEALASPRILVSTPHSASSDAQHIDPS
jgi:hypothetical protein